MNQLENSAMIQKTNEVYEIIKREFLILIKEENQDELNHLMEIKLVQDIIFYVLFFYYKLFNFTGFNNIHLYDNFNKTSIFFVQKCIEKKNSIIVAIL